MRGVRRSHGRRTRLAAPDSDPQWQPVTGGAASPGAIAAMPTHEVIVQPDGPSAAYSTIAYRGLAPIWTPDGAAVPARAPGRWAQLRQAGRP